MKKFLLFVAALGLVFLPSGVVYANGAPITYSTCITSQDGLPFSNMQIKVDNISQGYTDNNGCMAVTVQSHTDNNIELNGRKSFDPAVSDNNGLGYMVGFKTGYIESDTTDTIVIPITPVIINTTGVDGVSVDNALLNFTAEARIDTGRENIVYVRVGNSAYPMTGGNGYVQLGIPTGTKFGGYTIESDPSYGYETFSSQIDNDFLSTTSPKTINAVLQYPSPFGISDLSSTLDESGHAELSWTSSMQTGSIRVYSHLNSGQRLLVATLPYDATGYDLGTYATYGSHYYSVRSVNQYGYEGTDLRSLSVFYDHDYPVLDNFDLTPSRTEDGIAILGLKYHDDISNVANVEYFVGDDPGIGQGIQRGNTDSDGYSTDEIAYPLPVGTYTVGARAVDGAGNWSPTTYKTFEVTAAIPAPEDPPVEE